MLSLPHLRTVPRISSGFGRSTPRDAVASLVVARWPDVRIDEADVARTHEPDSALAVIQARVHLAAALLPADVVVELLRVHEPHPAPRAERVIARLWSAYSYHNGSYAFESTFPEDELLEPGRLMVRVSPAGSLALTTVLTPVTAPVVILPAEPGSVEAAKE